MDWSPYYPGSIDDGNFSTLSSSRNVEVADIGCGFGGLLFALAPRMPNTLLLGLEIRTSVTAYTQDKIKAKRAQYQQYQEQQEQQKRNQQPLLIPDSAPEDPSSNQPPPASFQNVACLRTNAMKFLPNFFKRSQLSKIFLCFPDPHFKARKHKARIVSAGLVAEYAFVLRPGGLLYTITDVADLHSWMVERLTESPSFVRLGDDDLLADECVHVMRSETEEGKKVAKNGGEKFVAVFRRLEDPPWP